MAGWVLLPLRAFLGFTFCFAGLQKLANPNFFNSQSPSGIQAQLIASERISPLHSLLGHLLHVATPLGILIALGELAVGVGALLGLWTRLAALGGMAISFLLFLTVSLHSSPYYTGSDIVFLFAWTPLVIAGAGGVLSLDAALAARAHEEAGLSTPTRVPVRFGAVRGICGHYDQRSCRARSGEPCSPVGCPYLAERPVRAERRAATEVRRRTVVLGAVAVGVAAVGTVLLAGLAAAVGRLAGGAKAPSGAGTATLGPPKSTSSTTTTTTAQAAGSTAPPATTTTTTAPAKEPAGTAIGAAADVPVGGAARFTDPSSGDPALVLQPAHGTFNAFDAVCPHAGCTVGYSSAARLLVCPCHGSQFNPTTGAVEVGPAPHGLARIAVAEGGDGQLYVDG
jgi:thiosulfate dehydrogenase [quinone] large subunit